MQMSRWSNLIHLCIYRNVVRAMNEVTERKCLQASVWYSLPIVGSIFLLPFAWFIFSGCDLLNCILFYLKHIVKLIIVIRRKTQIKCRGHEEISFHAGIPDGQLTPEFCTGLRQGKSRSGKRRALIGVYDIFLVWWTDRAHRNLLQSAGLFL